MAAYTKTLTETENVSDVSPPTWRREDPVQVRNFGLPSATASGLVWAGKSQLFWHSDIGTELIYFLNGDVANGAESIIIKSFSTPGGDIRGLAFDGKYLWCAGDVSNLIYKVDPATGTTIKSFSSPTTDPKGITWDGKYLWVTSGNTFYKLDPETGTIIQSFTSPHNNMGGPAYWGKYFYVANISSCYGAGVIYKYTITGVYIKKIATAACPSRAQAAIDKKYTYVACDASDKVFMHTESGGYA